jgi:hypothetical protein
MTIGVLVAGIGLVLAGLLAIGFGIPVKEFSFGNTLLLVGAMSVCTGAIMLALWTAVRELNVIARRLGAGMPEPRGEIAVRPMLPPGAVPPAAGGTLVSRDQLTAASAEPSAPPPWQDEAGSRDRPLEPAPEPAEPALRAKRNLLFSSTSRKERARAQARTSELLPPDLLSADIRPNPADAASPAEPAEPPPASFDNAWPKPERGRTGDIPPQRRGSGRPASAPEGNGAAARSGDQPAVTVLKSGVVDGMAYSLYSDGSIEAQMPEGMMRFASIDELRAHLDQRPSEDNNRTS